MRGALSVRGQSDYAAAMSRIGRYGWGFAAVFAVIGLAVALWTSFGAQSAAPRGAQGSVQAAPNQKAQIPSEYVQGVRRANPPPAGAAPPPAASSTGVPPRLDRGQSP